ncbi:MAG: RecX family transcriptional regulator [Candidatus Cloacimonetes bacterium]|nr:RecX family transcriptional regulator [Candidatus Cloacimonadota bacterium]MCF7813186.1 RecX family transcriptional regulator [Candidatus Cloacimonadota bacterium]MCF7867634.1 RecX family transcriptional regulator [Candidatus Cloacimonadota bacterium]MCF7883091.1 RecX family transcriptional regulator [Candidatus Cloacimonadota bacterium]
MKVRTKNKTKTIFIVSIDEEIWGTLPARVLRFFSILPDRENDIPDIKKADIINEIEIFNWDKLLNFLAYRERSIWECKNFLKQQFLPSQLIEKLLKKAVEKNFVNDERFAEMYVQDLTSKNKNERQIRSKLIAKHIPENVAEKVISENFSVKNKEQVLSVNYQKAVSKFYSLPTQKRKEKILNYLTRKGFSYWDVKQKMDEEGY